MPLSKFFLLLGGANCAENIRVTAAATEIPRQIFAHLVVCRIGVLIEESLDGENKSWCAVAALQGALFDERLLNGVKLLALAQSLNGDNGMSLHSYGQ